MPEACDTTEITADLALEADETIRRERVPAEVLKTTSSDGSDLDTVL